VSHDYCVLVALGCGLLIGAGVGWLVREFTMPTRTRLMRDCGRYLARAQNAERMLRSYPVESPDAEGRE
jgi:hypothetical protein